MYPRQQITTDNVNVFMGVGMSNHLLVYLNLIKIIYLLFCVCCLNDHQLFVIVLFPNCLLSCKIADAL